MELEITISVLVVGLIIVLAIMINFASRMLSLPAITGYFILGFLIKLVGEHFHLLSQFNYNIISFMSSMGIIALLFRIGLENKLTSLIRWLPKAGIIFIGDILVSGSLGFAAAYYLLGLELIPSLFVAAAFTPTSVGIAVAVWDDMKKLDTVEGKVMLDTAELDDLSGILLMGILLAVAPILHDNMGSSEIASIVMSTTGIFLIELLLFGVFCYLAAKFAEPRISRLLNKMHQGDSAMLVVAGMGLIVAAIASFIGFSFAIGAFFAGLIFSSDPSAVRLDASFEGIYELFTPFFFVGIGMAIDPAALAEIGIPVLVLLLAAVMGKFLGAGIPAALTLNRSAAVLIGVSMIPRAEIGLIIIQKGLLLGDWAVSPTLFLWIVIISGVTAVLVPVILKRMMRERTLKVELT